MRFKYILFDADDTLLDFAKDEETAFYALFHEKDLTPTPLLYHTYSKINLGLWKQYEREEINKDDINNLRFTNLLKEFGMDGDGIEYNQRFMFHLSEGYHLMKDVETVCKRLKEMGAELYVVTNGLAFIQKKRFARSGLERYFNNTFISELIGYQKPKKEFFDFAFNEIGCTDKSQYLIVGDSLTSDIKGGKNAGIATCWFNFSSVENTTDIKPDYTINNLIELLDIIK